MEVWDDIWSTMDLARVVQEAELMNLLPFMSKTHHLSPGGAYFESSKSRVGARVSLLSTQSEFDFVARTSLM